MTRAFVILFSLLVAVPAGAATFMDAPDIQRTGPNNIILDIAVPWGSQVVCKPLGEWRGTLSEMNSVTISTSPGATPTGVDLYIGQVKPVGGTTFSRKVGVCADETVTVQSTAGFTCPGSILPQNFVVEFE